MVYEGKGEKRKRWSAGKRKIRSAKNRIFFLVIKEEDAYGKGGRRRGRGGGGGGRRGRQVRDGGERKEQKE